MGMSIDEQIDGLRKAAVICTSVFAYDCQGYIKEAIDTLCKYQQLQANYETRLKADMVGMLEELKEQLREMHEDFFETEHFDEAYGVSDAMDVIQQKIDALKGN